MADEILPNGRDGSFNDATNPESHDDNLSDDKIDENENDEDEGEIYFHGDNMDLEAGGINIVNSYIEQSVEATNLREMEKINAVSNAASESSFTSTTFESAFHTKFESEIGSAFDNEIFKRKFESAFESAFKRAYEEQENKKDPSPEGKVLRDCYSFIALGFEEGNCFPFLFGCMVFLVQVGLLLLMVFSKTMRTLSENEDLDNPNQDKSGIFWGSFIPANASVIVRVTQFMAVLAFIFFGGKSLDNLTQGVMYFPVEKGNFWPRLASILKASQGLLACTTALLLVVTSTDVIDIILNFTAVHFISQFDNSAYALAQSGYYSKTLKDKAEKIKRMVLPTILKDMMGSQASLYFITVAFLGSMLMAMVTLVTIGGERSDVWTTRMLRVEFGAGSNLERYSGCYEMANVKLNRRMTYRHVTNNEFAPALAYCLDDHVWVFHQESIYRDPCNLASENNELAHSSKTYAFDVSTAFDGQWFSKTNKPLEINFFDNDENDEADLICGKNPNDGTCDKKLNKLIFNYDGGDCCASTCINHDSCNTSETKVIFEKAFGESYISGYGFPFCEDPDAGMIPVVIHIDEIIESVDATFESYPNLILSCTRGDKRLLIFELPLNSAMEGKKYETYIYNDITECNLQTIKDGDLDSSVSIKYRMDVGNGGKEKLVKFEGSTGKNATIPNIGLLIFQPGGECLNRITLSECIFLLV